MQRLLRHAKSATCVISILSCPFQLICRSCIPKEIDLTSVSVTIQLPYCISMLLLTRICKSAPAQYKQADENWHLDNKNAVIIWHLHEVFDENKLRLNKCSVSLYLSFMSELKVFLKLYCSTKRSSLVTKVGMAHA